MREGLGGHQCGGGVVTCLVCVSASVYLCEFLRVFVSFIASIYRLSISLCIFCLLSKWVV